MTAPAPDHTPRYDPMSHVASCPAATGEPDTSGTRCPVYPDEAHRCREERRSTSGRMHTVHRCLCRFGWVSSVAPA